MSSFSSLPSDIDNDSNTTPGSPSTRSADLSNNRKKRQSNIATNRSNKSHTSFFFRIDENNSELAYCKICEFDLSGTQKKPYAYSRKGGNTSSLINHLRDRHNITKDNHKQYLNEHGEVFLNLINCLQLFVF